MNQSNRNAALKIPIKSVMERGLTVSDEEWAVLMLCCCEFCRASLTSSTLAKLFKAGGKGVSKESVTNMRRPRRA